MEDLLQLEEFEWDEWNAQKNWLKHGVYFRESEQLFKNEPLNIFYDRQHSQDENRFAAFGRTDAGRLLTVIFTLRNNKIRIISARDRSRKERIYE